METFFFRNVIFSDALLGSLWDGKLTNFITEHWYQVFQGKENWRDLLMFYPHHDTIAYSDMLLGYGVLHSIFRFLGMDMFTAYKITLICTHTLGTISIYIMLKRYVKLNEFWAAFGTIIFSFSGSYSLSMEHTQLAAISYVPLCMIFCFRAWEGRENKKKVSLNIISAVTVLVFLLYTSWYIGYFLILFTCFSVLGYMIWSLLNKHNFVKDIVNVFRYFKWRLAMFFGYFMLVMVPFFALYLPSLNKNGKREWRELTGNMPELIDLLNVSTDNMMFGRIVSLLRLNERVYMSNEVRMGQPIIMYLFIAVLLIIMFRKGKTKTRNILGFSWLFLLFCYILIIRNKSGIALWYVVYKFIPAAASLRAVARWWFFLSLPLAVLIAITGNYVTKEWEWTKLQKEIAGLLCLVCIASNVIASGAYSKWNLNSEKMFMEYVKEPPKECRGFYIVNSGVEDNHFATIQMQAYEMATIYGIPTLNGYSGQYPEWYDYISDVDGEYYLENIPKYCQIFEIDDIYEYDLYKNNWKRIQIPKN